MAMYCVCVVSIILEIGLCVILVSHSFVNDYAIKDAFYRLSQTNNPYNRHQIVVAQQNAATTTFRINLLVLAVAAINGVGIIAMIKRLTWFKQTGCGKRSPPPIDIAR